MISVGGRYERAASSTLPQWKIDLVREAIRIIEGEKGRRVTAAMIARRIPSFAMADIEIAMRLLRAQRHREREQTVKESPAVRRGAEVIGPCGWRESDHNRNVAVIMPWDNVNF